MCQTCGKKKDLQPKKKKKIATSAVEWLHTGYDNNYKIKLAISFMRFVDWHVLSSVNNTR
jgi:hypothetical protein